MAMHKDKCPICAGKHKEKDHKKHKGIEIEIEIGKHHHKDKKDPKKKKPSMKSKESAMDHDVEQLRESNIRKNTKQGKLVPNDKKMVTIDYCGSEKSKKKKK